MFSFPLLVNVVDTKYFASMKMVTDFDRYAKPNNLQKKTPKKTKKTNMIELPLNKHLGMS